MLSGCRKSEMSARRELTVVINTIKSGLTQPIGWGLWTRPPPPPPNTKHTHTQNGRQSGCVREVVQVAPVNFRNLTEQEK